MLKQCLGAAIGFIFFDKDIVNEVKKNHFVAVCFLCFLCSAGCDWIWRAAGDFQLWFVGSFLLSNPVFLPSRLPSTSILRQSTSKSWEAYSTSSASQSSQHEVFLSTEIKFWRDLDLNFSSGFPRGECRSAFDFVRSSMSTHELGTAWGVTAKLQKVETCKSQGELTCG